MVEAGAQSFGTVCSACHGPGGAGTAAAPKLADNTWLHISGSFDEIVQIIHSGVPNPMEAPAPMPPLGGGNFSDEQVRQIAAYVFALSHQGQ
jgi:cbb3-type cytochrome c oxidase subunit III